MNLYDVEPTISYGSDYLGQAGHMVSLDLSTAVSTEMRLQEGTYSVSTSGAPGSYAAGYQTEFMDTMLPVGTYCEERNDNFQSFYGFVSSGTVTITKSGSGYRLSLIHILITTELATTARVEAAPTSSELPLA